LASPILSSLWEKAESTLTGLAHVRALCLYVLLVIRHLRERRNIAAYGASVGHTFYYTLKNKKAATYIEGLIDYCVF
jgi:hypothetical protein